MNHYGLLAKEHWERHAPAQYAALTDPTGFFSDLGESALTQIGAIATRMELDLPAELPYLERVGHLNAIRKQAEETVLQELVYAPTSTVASTDVVTELEETLDRFPSLAMIDEQLEAITARAQEDADREGRSTPSLTEEQQDRQDRLLQLRTIVKAATSPDLTQERARTFLEQLQSLQTR